MKIGEAAATTGMGAFDLELPFSGDAVFYSFGDVSHRRGSAGGFYRMPYQETQNVPEFYPDGFLPEIHPAMDDASITVGIRQQGAVERRREPDARHERVPVRHRGHR